MGHCRNLWSTYGVAVVVGSFPKRQKEQGCVGLQRDLAERLSNRAIQGCQARGVYRP